MLYEFVCGYVPFGEEEDDPYKIYGKILDRVLKYPNYISSTRCKPLIEKMLDPNPVMRGTIETLKENSWFSGVSWDSLLGKQVKPPYIPKTENFSASIQKSLKSSRGLSDIIREYEIDDSVNDNSRGKIAPSSWDEEF